MGPTRRAVRGPQPVVRRWWLDRRQRGCGRRLDGDNGHKTRVFAAVRDRAGSGANGGSEWVRVVGLHDLMTDDE